MSGSADPDRGAPPAASHALLAAALEHAGACVAVLVGDSLRFAFANAACRGWVGDGDPVGRDFADVFPQAAAAGAVARLRDVLARGERWTIDRERMPMPGLPDALWDGDATRLPATDGDAPSLVVVLRSATERVRGEQLLSRQRQLALDAARLGWWQYDPVLDRTTFDERFKAIFGVDGATISGPAFADRVHPDDLPPLLAALRHATDPADPQPYVARFRIGRDTDAVRWIESNGIATFEGAGDDRRAVAISGTIADVTDRHQAELALRHSESTLGAVLDALPAGVVIVDTQGRVVRHNAATRDLWGLPPETRSWEGYGEWQGWWPETGRRIEADEWAMTRALRHGEVTRGQLVTSQPFGSDGRRHFLNNVAPLRDADGAIVGAVAAMLDVSDRLAAERRLRESEWRLRVATDGAELGVFEWSLAGDEPRWENDRIFAIFGRTRGDGPLSMKQFMDEVLLPADRPLFERRMSAARDDGGSVRVAFRIRRADGALCWLECSGQFDRDGQGRASRLVGVVADITERKRVEASQRSTRDALRRLVDGSPFGVYVVDADFRMAQASVGARRLYGVVEPLLGRDVAEVMHEVWCESDAVEIVSRFRRALEHGEPHHAPDSRLQRRDGSELDAYDWRIEQVQLPDGRPGVVCHFYDLSERQRYESALRDSEERFRQLADAMPQLVWTADGDGRVNYFNSRAADYRGIVATGDGGYAWSDLIHPDDLPRTLSTWRRTVEGGPDYEIEYRMWMADGSYRWHLGRAHGGAGGGSGRWFGTSTDVHQLKMAEEALRDADRRKDDFLAILAHELRNPLAPIRTGVQILRLSPALADSKALPMMERQVRHMSRLLDDLLDVGRITRGVIELRREPIELATLVHAASDACRPLIEQMNHRLEIALPATPVTLDVDPVRITQVFSNLLNNAAKYMDAGGRIDLHAVLDGGEVVVSVVDRGVGIAAENLSPIFEMFFQVGTALSRSQGGLGVGLSLARGLVALHGGRIEARSGGAGRGAEFVVRLPVLQPVASAAVDDIGAPPASRLRILVVDDNQDAAASLSLLLELSGHEVAVEFGGAAALAAAAGFAPQLALVDLGMPGMDGYEVCRRLRQQPCGAAMTIIAVTGWGQDEDRRRTQAAGFDGHLVKPVDADVLLALVAGLPLRTGAVPLPAPAVPAVDA